MDAGRWYCVNTVGIVRSVLYYWGIACAGSGKGVSIVQVQPLCRNYSCDLQFPLAKDFRCCISLLQMLCQILNRQKIMCYLLIRFDMICSIHQNMLCAYSATI